MLGVREERDKGKIRGEKESNMQGICLSINILMQEFRKEHGIPVHITRDQVNDNIYQARSSFYLPCKIDKQGRAIT